MPTVVAVNIPHQLRSKGARRLTAAALRLAGPDGVVLAVEMDAENDKALRSILERTVRRVWFWRRKTQVITPKSWSETIPWQRTLTDAKAGVNPARDLNGVMDCDRRIIWAAMHAPNGKNKVGKSFRAWRERQWNRYQARAGRKVSNKTARGWSWVIGGDPNDVRNGVVFDEERQVTLGHAGLTWVVAVPAPGYRVLADKAEAFNLPGADHPAVRVRNIRFVKENA